MMVVAPLDTAYTPLRPTQDAPCQLRSRLNCGIIGSTPLQSGRGPKPKIVLICGAG